MSESIWNEAPPAPASGKSEIKARITRYASGLCAAQITMKTNAQDEYLGGCIVDQEVGVQICTSAGKRLVAVSVDGDSHQVTKGSRGAATIAFGVIEGMLREAVVATPMRIVEVSIGERLVLELPPELFGESSDG